MEAVRAQVGRATMHANIPQEVEPPGGFADYAEYVLAWRARHIVFAWIQRLREEAPWSERDDLGLGDLIDHAPVLLKALDVRLHYADPAGFFERHPEALERAQQHARPRAQQGISLAATIREYALLREQIWLALRSAPPATVDPEQFFQVEQAINGTLDALLTGTSAAFLGEALPPHTLEIPPT